MDRKERFMLLKAHPMYGKGINSLSPAERELMEKFLREHNTDTQAVWSVALRKLFVDNPAKPKNWTLIYELLQTLA